MSLTATREQKLQNTIIGPHNKEQKKPYQFVYTDFISLITPIDFGIERYFFIFTDDYIRITKSYTAKQKNK